MRITVKSQCEFTASFSICVSSEGTPGRLTFSFLSIVSLKNSQDEQTVYNQWKYRTCEIMWNNRTVNTRVSWLPVSLSQTNPRLWSAWQWQCFCRCNWVSVLSVCVERGAKTGSWWKTMNSVAFVVRTAQFFLCRSSDRERSRKNL